MREGRRLWRPIVVSLTLIACALGKSRSATTVTENTPSANQTIQNVSYDDGSATELSETVLEENTSRRVATMTFKINGSVALTGQSEFIEGDVPSYMLWLTDGHRRIQL